VFVLPEEGIGATRKEHVMLAAAGASPYEQKGSLDDWKAGIGELVAGHARPALAVSMAFAGPLLLVAGMDGGGVNLFGQSSRARAHVQKLLLASGARETLPASCDLGAQLRTRSKALRQFQTIPCLPSMSLA
jgi:uncharacterized protein (DUF927 family)